MQHKEYPTLFSSRPSGSDLGGPRFVVAAYDYRADAQKRVPPETFPRNNKAVTIFRKLLYTHPGILDFQVQFIDDVLQTDIF